MSPQSAGLAAPRRLGATSRRDWCSVSPVRERVVDNAYDPLFRFRRRDKRDGR